MQTEEKYLVISGLCVMEMAQNFAQKVVLKPGLIVNLIIYRVRQRGSSFIVTLKFSTAAGLSFVKPTCNY